MARIIFSFLLIYFDFQSLLFISYLMYICQLDLHRTKISFENYLEYAICSWFQDEAFSENNSLAFELHLLFSGCCITMLCLLLTWTDAHSPANYFNSSLVVWSGILKAMTVKSLGAMLFSSIFLFVSVWNLENKVYMIKRIKINKEFVETINIFGKE